MNHFGKESTFLIYLNERQGTAHRASTDNPALELMKMCKIGRR